MAESVTTLAGRYGHVADALVAAGEINSDEVIGDAVAFLKGRLSPA